MSSVNQDAKLPILARQNPATGAALLRKLSRWQLQLWREIGRAGMTLADLELRHPRSGLLEELQNLEAKGMIFLEEVPAKQTRQSFSAHGRAGPQEAEPQPLQEGPMPAPARRTPPSRPPPAQELPQQFQSAPALASPAETGPVDTSPVDTSPVDTSPVDTSPVDTSALQEWADDRTLESRPFQVVPEASSISTSSLQQWADERTDEDVPILAPLDTAPLHEMSSDSKSVPDIPLPEAPAPRGYGPDIPLPEASSPEISARARPASQPQPAPQRAQQPEQPSAAASPGIVSGKAVSDPALPNLTAQERKLFQSKVDLKDAEKSRILQVARAVESGDICGLLGLPNTAKRREVKRSYHALSKELHPDQYFGRDLGGFRPLLEQVFSSLSQYVKALNDKRTTLPSSYRTNNQSRRRSQRFHLKLRAQVQCDSWDGPEWASTQDISDGGLFLVTDKHASVGEAIRLNIEGPNGIIGIIGKVVSICDADQARRQRRNSGFGIRFEGAAKIDYERLKSLMEKARENTPAFTAAMPVRSDVAQKLARGSRIIHRKDPIIGIDLGTTNTAVSAVIDNRVQILPWPNGSYSMPSVVSFPERGKCVVGHEAQQHLLRDPRNVINSGKRLVGRQIDDPTIASYMAEARFAHHRGPDGTIIAKIWGEEYAIPQICSYLFSAARHAATQTVGKEPRKAVLTVPVSFEQEQIDSVRRAAKLAQLDVVEIIEEPCAAAIANQGQKDFKGIVGVYDFGGGTFDFSLVEAGAGDLRVLATTGDSWLGGDDFDIAIADVAADMFWKSQGTDLRQRVVEWQYLIYACEQAKRELSRKDRSQIVVPEVMRNAQGTIDLRLPVARAEVEKLWAEPIRRSVDTCNQALSLAGVPKSKLSAIYMSGGTSYIPAIRRTLIERFKVPVHLGLAPEHAVCAGAGVRAAVLQGTLGLSPGSRNNRR